MTSSSSPAAKLSAYLSQLNPVPTFPDYTGPYKVGTVDVEIPVSELESPSHAAESAADIYTASPSAGCPRLSATMSLPTPSLSASSPCWPTLSPSYPATSTTRPFPPSRTPTSSSPTHPMGDGLR
ncbi:hypothetical protein HYQ46_007852 [Verticillium longisporum]|nr:hypothetical protein HYQ46_007852 [Verticillium longisporum]